MRLLHFQANGRGAETEQKSMSHRSGNRACEVGTEVSESIFAKVPIREGPNVVAGDDEWMGGSTKVQGVVKSKLHAQRPFALTGSSGTMAVQIDTGETGRQAGDMSPGKEFFFE